MKHGGKIICLKYDEVKNPPSYIRRAVGLHKIHFKGILKNSEIVLFPAKLEELATI
jgi:hypothetical protein